MPQRFPSESVQVPDRGGAAALAAEVRRRLGPPPQLPDWPLVSIVVLNRDGVEHLRRLLAGLTGHTDYPHLELIVVDNASSDGSLDLLRTAEAPFPISILANAHNESFSDACNQGAALAAGELLLFLNNDAEPFERGWLRDLVACLLSSDAGIAGPTLLEPAAAPGPAHGYAVHQRGLRAREAGGLLVTDYRGHGADPLGDRLGQDADVVAVAAACLLIGRRTFDRVDGFSHGYMYGPEDVDLALKVRQAGAPARCSGRSLLIHPPNTTLNTVDAEQRGSWVRGNRRLFLERWGPRVRREYELDRLAGGGLWSEPDGSPPPAADAGATGHAEVEALSYCLRPGRPSALPPEVLRLVGAALRHRGRRCLVLGPAEEDDLRALECDVAVHLRGAARHIPRPARLNVLWSVGGGAAASAAECSRYDLVVGAAAEVDRLRAEGLSTPAVPIEGAAELEAGDGNPCDRFAVTLLEAVERRAREVGLATTVGRLGLVFAR